MTDSSDLRSLNDLAIAVSSLDNTLSMEKTRRASLQQRLEKVEAGLNNLSTALRAVLLVYKSCEMRLELMEAREEAKKEKEEKKGETKKEKKKKKKKKTTWVGANDEWFD